MPVSIQWLEDFFQCFILCVCVYVCMCACTWVCEYRCTFGGQRTTWEAGSLLSQCCFGECNSGHQALAASPFTYWAILHLWRWLSTNTLNYDVLRAGCLCGRKEQMKPHLQCLNWLLLTQWLDLWWPQEPLEQDSQATIIRSDPGLQMMREDTKQLKREGL